MTKIEQGAPRGMNESSTGTPIGTELTQGRSGFDLKVVRAYLIAKRDFYGAKSAIGFRCSNMVEQLEELQKGFDSCDHKWSPHIDEMGDPGQYCEHCSGFVRDENFPDLFGAAAPYAEDRGTP